MNQYDIRNAAMQQQMAQSSGNFLGGLGGLGNALGLLCQPTYTNTSFTLSNSGTTTINFPLRPAAPARILTSNLGTALAWLDHRIDEVRVRL